MDSAQDATIPESSYTKWPLFVFIALGILALCAYDLNPIWGRNARENEARALVPNGTPQAVAERVLLANGFDIRPGEWPPTLPTGFAWLFHRRSVLADSIAAVGLIAKPAQYCVILRFDNSGC